MRRRSRSAKRDTAIFLCDVTGNMARPWAEAGYTCYCVDIQHPIRIPRSEGNIHFVWGDVRSWCPPEPMNIIFVAGFPPCTHVTRSGAQDWLLKGHYLLSDSLQLWSSCMQLGAWSGARYCVENPIGAISSHMREPDFTFDPCDYAGYLPKAQQRKEAYTKNTCLWVGNGFIMPTPRRVEPVRGSALWKLGPSEERAYLRSTTPMGFARAVFEANRPR